MKTTVHMLKHGMANAYLITGGTPVLVDTGDVCSKELFIDECRACGIEPEDIALIIITHEHLDHFAHAKWIRELTGAKVLCHYLAADSLIFGKKPTIVPRSIVGVKALQDVRQNPPPVDNLDGSVIPDILIYQETSLKPYGIDGKIVLTPGHSKGSISVLLDSGEALIGDILLKSHFSDELVVCFFADEPEKVRSTMDYLMENATIFYSGHGGPYTLADVKEAVSKDEDFNTVMEKQQK